MKSSLIFRMDPGFIISSYISLADLHNSIKFHHNQIWEVHLTLYAKTIILQSLISETTLIFWAFIVLKMTVYNSI